MRGQEVPGAGSCSHCSLLHWELLPCAGAHWLPIWRSPHPGIREHMVYSKEIQCWTSAASLRDHGGRRGWCQAVVSAAGTRRMLEACRVLTATASASAGMDAGTALELLRAFHTHTLVFLGWLWMRAEHQELVQQQNQPVLRIAPQRPMYGTQILPLHKIRCQKMVSGRNQMGSGMLSCSLLL